MLKAIPIIRRAVPMLAAAAIGLLMLVPLAQAAPLNDEFSAASTVSPGSVSGSTFEGTKESGEPNHAGDPGGHSVWFSWTPTKSGPVGIASASCFSSLDVAIGVYTGSAVNALTEIASNQGVPPPSGCPFSEPNEFEFTVTAGTTYWIAVDGKGGAQGFFSFDLRAAPANDDFSAATVLGALPQEASGTVKFATKETGEPNHAGDPGGHSVWFSWTPSVSGPVEISTCSPFSNLDPMIAVYTGSAVDALTPVIANDDTPLPTNFPECIHTDSRVRIDVTAGTTYRIAVDGASGTVGRFNLYFRGRPANDAFTAPAALLPGLPTNATAGTSTRMGTKETGEPSHAGDPGGHSVWFTWTPSVSGPVAISVCPNGVEDFDTLIAVYTGSAVDALTEVASNDDTDAACGMSGSEVQFEAVAGTTYRIAVDGKGGVEGRFTLYLQGGPANDAFASAQNLGGAPSTGGFASAKLATKEAGEPNHAGIPGGHSVWFTWTPTSSGSTAITTCPYNEFGGYPVLAVYTGSAVNALTPVASDANGGAGCDPAASEVEFTATAGTTYRIAVDTSGSGGHVDLQINGEPANDAFASPTTISPTPMFANGSTRFATKETGEPNHAGNAGGGSVWFSWTPDESGPVDLSACSSSGLDTLLGVYTGSAVDALTEVASNDDAPGGVEAEFCAASGSEVEFEAVAGTTYRIAVDGKGAGQGQFYLSFVRAPSNDAFADANQVNTTLPAFGSVNTKLATKETGEPNHAGIPGGHSVWFSFTPPTSRKVSIYTCHNELSEVDTLLGVYTGSAVDALTEVASNDDADGRCMEGDSEVQLDAVGGTTYWIAIDGKGGSAGEAQLALEAGETNDDFAKPRPLGGIAPTGWFGSNRFATKQIDEPDHAGQAGGSSVWFKWTAPRTGQVSVDTCDSKLDTLLGVYTGSALDDLTSVAGNDDAGGKCGTRSRLVFDAVANTAYRIAVDGKGGAQGLVQLSVIGAPENDAFAAPRNLRGVLPLYVGEIRNVLATKETGEPNHGGDLGGHSVWFTWKAPRSATVALGACTESFTPVLGVYTGSALNGLAPVATSDDGSGECDDGSGVTFSAVAGTTYRIAVDGSGAETGDFRLWFDEVEAAATWLLSVQKAGSGSGSVSSTPAGITCGSVCSAAFGTGSAVTLSAAPAAGSSFAGWSGGGCSGSGTCQVMLGADVTVTATFQPLASGGGGGTGGGGSAGSGGGSGAGPAPKPKPKPLKCKPGFKKVKVKGKQKCVKKKPAKGKGKSRGGKR